jgi:Rrf2 family cysteine metabolism transcriptional repressor
MLSLTTKGRYAARIMVYLARHQGPLPATKRDIAKVEGISANYIEQILTRLKVAQLVNSHRGRGGGFSLARAPGKISLADVLRALEGPVCVAPCVQAKCPRAARCGMRSVWRSLSDKIESELQGLSIEALAAEA